MKPNVFKNFAANNTLEVIPKVASSFFAKWLHLSLQSGHFVSPESVQSAVFKGF